MTNIQVTYDGKYPNTCSGTLTIIVDGEQVYSEKHQCHSTGRVWFDKEWCEHVECGELVWDEEDALRFSAEIQEAVKEEDGNYDPRPTGT